MASQIRPARPHRTFSQYWKTFVRNHAQSIVACDFFVVVTSRFRILYVFLLMELGTRRILHCNLTAHPTAEWTLQQFRDAIPTDHAYRFLVRDRDSIFSVEVDDQLNQGRPHSSLGPGIPESVQMAFLDNLTADTSQPGIARSRLGRYSAAYITNTAEKGARHGTGKRICARTPLFQPQNLA
ncbi:MAG: hypothetical protein DMG31_02515 [Acidobacteria bacterium]|nr:MAG: hypothetical protein DMG31_02515 [Acidobacteriota bacterium]